MKHPGVNCSVDVTLVAANLTFFQSDIFFMYFVMWPAFTKLKPLKADYHIHGLISAYAYFKNFKEICTNTQYALNNEGKN